MTENQQIHESIKTFLGLAKSLGLFSKMDTDKTDECTRRVLDLVESYGDEGKLAITMVSQELVKNAEKQAKNRAVDALHDILGEIRAKRDKDNL